MLPPVPPVGAGAGVVGTGVVGVVGVVVVVTAGAVVVAVVGASLAFAQSWKP